MGEKRGMQALEIWCKRATAGYRGVNVTNMTSSWRDGMAFCAMIHHFRPDLIDFASLCPSNVYANNELAFTVAETHLGIPALLDPEDMVKCAVPDRLSILTYLSQFYQVLASKGTSPLIGSVKRPSDSTPFNASSAGGSPVKVLTQQLHQEKSPKGGRRPDLCVTCQNAVFLAERLLVNSKLHHRTCFRCARCASQLSLANYYETEKGQYCCETCPDEVVVDDSEPCPVVCTSSRPSSPCDQVNRGTAEAAPASATADITASATSFTPTKLQFLHSLVSVPLQDPGPDAPPQSQPVTEPDDPPSGGQHRPTPAADAVIEPTSETPAGDSAPTRDIVLKDQVLDDRPVEPLPDVCATTPVDAQVADLSIASDADAAVVAVEASPENPFDTASESEEAATDRPTEDVAAVSSTVDDAADTSPDDSTVQSPSDAVAEEQPAVVVVEEEPAAVVVEEEPAVVLVEEEPDVVVGDEEPAAAVVEEEPAVVVVVEEEPDVVVGEQATLGKDEEAAGDMKSSANEPIISIRVTGPEEEEKQQQQDVPEEVVVPIPRRRSRRRTDETTTTTAAAAAVSSPTKAEAEAEYPDDLNPFGDEDDEAEASRATDTSSCTLNPFGSDDGDDSDVVTAQPPRVSLNPFGSDDEDEDEVQRRPKNKPQRPPPPSMTPTLSPTPTFSRTSSYKKRPAPPPPTPPTSAMASLRRKEKPAPPPPPPAPTLEAQQRLSADSDSDVVRREKSAKELSNLTVQCGVNKDSHGQWKRKKGPAPPRPMPQKRQLRKQPLKMIQQELTDIEAKQLELERQGVALERTIRAVTDSEAEALVPAGVEVEEMILQLFDLVNEKNELLRRQTELMYVRRQQRLEEEHAELEFQIRCLLEKPPAEKTDDDRVREEELIQRLVHVVHRRAEIVDCLELERRREFEEDQSIQQHLEVFNSRSPDAAATTSSPTVLPPKAPSKSKTLKLIQSPIKLMKKDKHKKASKKVHDADKDIDESESESASPAKASASGADADAAAAAKETDKDKKKSKSWFNK